VVTILYLAVLELVIHKLTPPCQSTLDPMAISGGAAVKAAVTRLKDVLAAMAEQQSS